MTESRKGQLSVEFVFLLLFWAALWSGALALFKSGLEARRAGALARLGAMAGSLEDATPEVISEVLSRGANFLRVDGSGAAVDTGRFLGTPASKFYDLWQVRVRGRHTGFLVIQKEGSS